MADDGPRRHISVPIKGDRWRHQTVQGHIPHPLRQYRFRTVYDHISTPATNQSQTLQQTYKYRIVHDHISTPVTTRPRAQTLQQRKRQRHLSLDSPHYTVAQSGRGQQRKRHRGPSLDSPQYTIAQSGRGQRRRVEPESPTPTRSLTDDYNKRKAATARFPPKITPQHLRAANGKAGWFFPRLL